MLAPQETQIDTRILKAEYRNYDLIARYWNGEYRGRIWKNKEKVADYDGDNLDIIFENLTSIVDQIIEQKKKARGDNSIDDSAYLSAFTGILPKISPDQSAMLTLHANASKHTATLEELRLAGNFSSLKIVADQYLKVAKRLCDELSSFNDSASDAETLAALLNNPQALEEEKKDAKLTLIPAAAKAYLHSLNKS
jgi:hypothetical protein